MHLSRLLPPRSRNNNQILRPRPRPRPRNGSFDSIGWHACKRCCFMFYCPRSTTLCWRCLSCKDLHRRRRAYTPHPDKTTSSRLRCTKRTTTVAPIDDTKTQRMLRALHLFRRAKRPVASSLQCLSDSQRQPLCASPRHQGGRDAHDALLSHNRAPYLVAKMVPAAHARCYTLETYPGYRRWPRHLRVPLQTRRKQMSIE